MLPIYAAMQFYAARQKEETRRVFRQAHQQPEEIQRQIAEIFALVLEGAESNTLLGTPKSQESLARPSREVDEQITAGEVEVKIGASRPAVLAETHQMTLYRRR